MKTHSLLLFIGLMLFSCHRPVLHVRNTGMPAADSLMFYRQDSILTIRVGGSITASPYSSQVYDRNGQEEYIMLDRNTLYSFDLYSGGLLWQSKIEMCGDLNNYSGFLYCPDSIFVYNYKQKMAYVLDSAMHPLKSWDIMKPCVAKYPLDPETLVGSPMLYVDGRLVLSGTEMRVASDATAENKPLSCLIECQSDSIVYGMGYPEQYLRGNFGGVYFNSIYHTLGADGEIVYSFPADHFLHIARHSFSDTCRVYMGSRYAVDIASSSLTEMDVFKDKNKRIAYYVSQPSYANILYVNLMNIHVSREGLLIQKENKDENIIEFVVYKLKSYEE